jgi:hypothetical protein
MESSEKYGRLTLVRGTGERRIFLCDCGAHKEMLWRNVRTGKSQSCGCLHKERTAAAKTTHGHSRHGKITPEFQAYRSMMARCYRRTNNRFSEYGGRGITVCGRWKGDFAAFLADVGHRPSPRHSIDRTNNDGNYEPSNVQWATKQKQGRNKRNNVAVVAHGRKMTLVEAASQFGVPYSTLKARIVYYGWSHDRAISEPVRSLSR